ncbi:AfsR/SARP family transcriptional regulator [Virgisporangium ochraceum]|nr:BTAD domain-containing putative transcriptional regulator [Virgisporangium ochraceum]
MFAVLGPLRVHLDGEPVSLGAKKQRTVLALLVARANRTVGLDDLIDEVWPDDPPESAVANVRTYAANLRRAFAAAGSPDVIVRSGDGYQLTLDPPTCDALVFDDLRQRAADARAGGDLAGSARLLEEAGRLWRGSALAGVAAGTRLRAYAAALDEAQLATVEELAEVRVDLGAAAAALPALRELVTAHPLRERAQALLMRALHRQGDVAAALRVYTEARAALVEHLGVEPGPVLRAAQREILAATAAEPPDPGPKEPAPAPVRPAQLPGDLPAFTGRAGHLRQLDEALAASRNGPSPAVLITAIAGTAGVGKTALAVHWAHRIRESFPDGQLYVNLRGFDPSGSPVGAAEALRGFLDALGVAAERVPPDLAERAALYRSLLADRRLLVVLDNARDAGQVRPLLPGSSSLAVVTSRSDLAGLVVSEGALPVVLDVLPAHEAHALLVRRMGARRLAAEPEAAREIVTRCARLPLALAVVAARAVLRPDLPLATIAADLREAMRPDPSRSADLAPFRQADPATDLRSVFASSYRALDPVPARVFRLIGLTPGPDIGLPAVASLAGYPLDRARAALDALVAANLVVALPWGRFGLHDLLRAYAREQVGAGEAEPALRRLVDHYTHVADAGSRLLHSRRGHEPLPDPVPGVVPPALADAADALRWFAHERPLLVDAVRTAARSRPARAAWDLALAMYVFFYRQGYLDQAVDALRAALGAARGAGDRTAEAQVRRALAGMYVRLGRVGEAGDELRLTAELFEAVGDRLERAHTQGTLAQLNYSTGEFDRALEFSESARELYREVGHRNGEARTLNAIGWIHAQRGDFEKALVFCTGALDLHQAGDDRVDAAHAWDSLGYVQHQLGRFADAVASFEEALLRFRESGDRYEEASTLENLGAAQADAGDVTAAADAWRRAATILDDLGHPAAATLRDRLANLPQPTTPVASSGSAAP